MSSLLHISILLSLIFIYNVSSQCSDLDSSICSNDGYCSLLSNNDCVCSKEWNQDIAFIFDSSMTIQEWLYARQFAIDLLYYGSPSNTRSAIIQTINDANSEPTPTKSFGDEHSVSPLIQHYKLFKHMSLIYILRCYICCYLFIQLFLFIKYTKIINHICISSN